MYSTANISIRDSFLLFFFVALFVCLFFTKTKKEKLAKKKNGYTELGSPGQPDEEETAEDGRTNEAI